MYIHSVNPINLELVDEETYFKGTFQELSDEYFQIGFTDNYDDILEPNQSIKIHRNDLVKFVEMLNRAVNLL